MNMNAPNPTDGPRAVHYILAIDDEVRNLALLEQLMKMVGASEFHGFTHPSEALQHLGLHEPDLILIDWHMPGVEGPALLQELRGRLGKETYVPIVVLTADESTATRLLALKAGATDFLN